MPRSGQYTADRLFTDLIDDNLTLLTTTSRFGLSLGFGDKRVGEVCAIQGVDCATFLLVANFLSGGETQDGSVSVAALTDYLKAAHAYFLDYALPDIRQRLIAALACADKDGYGDAHNTLF